MAMKKHGGFMEVFGEPYQMQIDRSIRRKREGTLEGTIKFICDRADVDSLPDMGALHVDDDRMELFNIELVYNGLELATMTASYFGLSESSPNGGDGLVVSFSGGSNNDPIETHPDFTTDIAGTPGEPQFGAVFDPVTGQFLRFEPDTQHAGVQYYLTPATQITISYWKSSVPQLKKRMEIVNSISGVSLPADVKNLLRVETSYRTTGSSYQVTEVYLASGVDGWDPIIYP